MEIGKIINDADLNKPRNIFMSILKDIKDDYRNTPQDIGQTEFQENWHSELFKHISERTANNTD